MTKDTVKDLVVEDEGIVSMGLRYNIGLFDLIPE